MSNRLIYRDDLHGYDDLLTFADIFDSFNTWQTELNDYLFYCQIGDMTSYDALPNITDEKIFNLLYNVYRTHFFRFANKAKVLNEIAQRVNSLYQDILTADYISTNAESLAGQTTVSNNFRTDNTQMDDDEENEIKYRHSGNTTSVDNGDRVIELAENSVQGVKRINRFIDEFRTLMMNQTNEVVDMEIYAKNRK